MDKIKIIVIFFIMIGVIIVPYTNADIVSKNISSKNSFSMKNSNKYWSTFQNNPARTGFSDCSMPDELEILWSSDEYYSIDDNSPIIYQDKFYACSTYGDVYCLNALNGEEIWRINTGEGNWIDATPTIYNENLYVGVDKDIGNCDIGEFYCYDALTGYELWRFTTDDPIEEAIAAYDNKVYFVSEKIYCLDAEYGEEIWTYEIPGSYTSSIAISNDRLLIGLQDTNSIYCIDSENGELIWIYEADGNPNTPTIYDGKVFFATSSGTIYCLDIYDGYDIWIEPTDYQITASLAIAYDKIYVGSSSREAGLFYCFDAYSGFEIWRYQTPYGYYGYEPIESSAAIADGKVYFGGGGSDHSYHPQGFIYCLDAENGEELFKYSTDPSLGPNSDIESSPAISNGIVYFTVRGGKKYIYALSGEIKGPSKPIIEGPSSGEDGVEYFYTFTSFDEDGEELRYYIDWGDDKVTGWTEGYSSGEPCELYHTWYSEGSFTIKAKALNSYNEESDWGELEVSMPRSKSRGDLFEILLNNFMKLSLKFELLNWT